MSWQTRVVFVPSLQQVSQKEKTIGLLRTRKLPPQSETSVTIVGMVQLELQRNHQPSQGDKSSVGYVDAPFASDPIRWAIENVEPLSALESSG